jgi:predicted nucleotidyltransferase
MTELQERVLAVLSAEAAMRDFIKEMYVFGSVARGEKSPDDLDICFEYDDDWVRSAHFNPRADEWEAGGLHDWAASLSLTLGIRVEPHDLRDQSDAAMKHVIENRKSPLKVLGEAMLVWTPKMK